MKQTLRGLILLTTLAPIVLALQPGTVRPRQCSIGVEAPDVGFWTWPANAHVSVYVLSADFQTAEVPYLLIALKNWNSVSGETGAGVIFDYQGTTTQQKFCKNCLTIMRGSVFDKRTNHAAELRAYSLESDQIMTYAAIVIDPALTNLRALTDTVAHELGHNLGLRDCYSCNSRFTVMSKLKALNVPNQADGPKFCDIAQVKHAYDQLRIRVGTAPQSAISAGDDAGEEPIDDDSPIVVLQP